MNEAKFQGVGGIGIFYRSWLPAKARRGVLVLAHGFNAHSGHYRATAEQLAARGFAVYAFDHRGRGRSDGERYYVDKFADYVSDLASCIALAKSQQAGLPVFVLGHSMGGVVAATYALDHQAEIAGLICESLAFQVYAPDFALAALKGLSHVAPHAHVLKLKLEDFSRDPEVVRALRDDPLIQNEVEATKTVAEMVRADERLARDVQLIQLPLLVLHGTQDKVTKPAGSKLLYEGAGSQDKTLKLYDGHAHDLLNDLDKAVVLADIVSWLERRTIER